MDNKEKIKQAFEATNKIISFRVLAEESKIARQSIDHTSLPMYHVECLDRRMKRIKNNTLTVFGAYSSTGKTQMANNIVIENALAGKVVLYFMLEGDIQEVYQRYMRTEIKKTIPMDLVDFDLNIDPYGTIRHKEDELYSKIPENILDNLLIFKKEHIPNMQEIVNIVSALEKKVDLIVIDHLQYIAMPDDATENKAISEIMQTAKNITDNIRKPVIIFSHLRKKDPKAKDKRLDMEDLHGSSNIYKQANNVILFEPVCDNTGAYVKTEDGDFITRFVIAKSRVGIGANRDTSYMRYSPRIQSYVSEIDYDPTSITKS